jgi:hypothetical protein
MKMVTAEKRKKRAEFPLFLMLLFLRFYFFSAPVAPQLGHA